MSNCDGFGAVPVAEEKDVKEEDEEDEEVILFGVKEGAVAERPEDREFARLRQGDPIGLARKEEEEKEAETVIDLDFAFGEWNALGDWNALCICGGASSEDTDGEGDDEDTLPFTPV